MGATRRARGFGREAAKPQRDGMFRASHRMLPRSHLCGPATWRPSASEAPAHRGSLRPLSPKSGSARGAALRSGASVRRRHEQRCDGEILVEVGPVDSHAPADQAIRRPRGGAPTPHKRPQAPPPSGRGACVFSTCPLYVRRAFRITSRRQGTVRPGRPRQPSGRSWSAVQSRPRRMRGRSRWRCTPSPSCC
jgi:hypothetical protein